MEHPFDVTIDVGIDYDIGSPPDGDLDPYTQTDPEEGRYTESWQTREGPSEGVITDGTTALYPPFTDPLRRQVFCVLNFVVDTTWLKWHAENFPIGRIFLTTDAGWNATSVVVNDLGEGSWFACEGELEEEFREWRVGNQNPAGL